MSFSDIKDQEYAIRLLRNLIEQQRVPNGMLFWGPSGVGKEMAALEFAKALNCKAGINDACGQCLSCRKIDHGNHPDVWVVTPTDKTRQIRNDAIDLVNELTALRPTESRWRVFVLVDADRMNIRAQTHFLKTLEEPPSRSSFILTSEYPQQIMPTIRSRCQMIRFRNLRRQTVSELLRQQRDLPVDVADALADLSGGQVSRALDLVDSEKRVVALSIAERLATGDDPVTMAEEFQNLLDGQRKQFEAALKAEASAAKLDDEFRADYELLQHQRLAQLAAAVRRETFEYLYLLQTWYRDELVARATGSTERVWNKDQKAKIGKVRGDLSAKIAAIDAARQYLDRYIPEERVFRHLFFVLAAD